MSLKDMADRSEQGNSQDQSPNGIEPGMDRQVETVLGGKAERVRQGTRRKGTETGQVNRRINDIETRRIAILDTVGTWYDTPQGSPGSFNLTPTLPYQACLSIRNTEITTQNQSASFWNR